MASTRDFRELVDILSNRKPLPDSKFLTYSLPLTDKQLEELEPLLKDHPTLKGLRLKGCRISDEGADVLSRVLAFNTVLEVLELPKNDISSQGALYFANALRQWNHTLTQLDLQDNPCLVDIATMQEIAQHLTRNTTKVARSTSPRLASSPYKIMEVDKSWDSTTSSQLMLPHAAGMVVGAVSSVQLESRVLYLENDLEAHAEELEKLKDLGIELTGWKAQLDIASGQMAQVLEMLKQEIDELREKVASHEGVQPAAPQPGPDALARLATQFRSKHEELQRALERVQDVVASKPGAGDTHKLLVDAVDYLTRRVDSLENGSAEQEVTAAAVNRLCQQVQELEARHKAMDAGAASVAQLAAQQEQLSKTMAMGPQMDVAMGRLDDLQQLVKSLGEEVSNAVATLASTCMELQEHVASRASLEQAVDRIAAEATAAAQLASTASAGVRGLEEGQGHLQQEVGQLHLTVGVLEQTLDSLDASSRLDQHEVCLMKLQSSHGELRSSLEKKTEALGEQGSRLESVAWDLRAAIDQLKTDLGQQPIRWREEVQLLAKPLRQQIAAQEEALGAVREAAAGAAAQAGSNASALRALQDAVSGHPAKWQADVGAAAAPLQQQLAAQEEALGAVKDAAASAAEQAARSDAALLALQSVVSGHPAQWQADVGAALAPLQQQLAEQGEALRAASSAAADIAAKAGSTDAALAALKEVVGGQPSQWQADVQAATASLQRQLAQQEEALRAASQATAKLAAEVASTDAAVQMLQDTVEGQPAKWQADVRAAAAALHQQLAAQQEDLGAAKEAAAAAAAQASAADATLQALQEAADQQPAKWQAAVRAAAGPLQLQLSALEAQQETDAKTLQAATKSLGARVDDTEADIASLKQKHDEAVSTSASLQAALDAQPWQPDIAAAVQQVEQGAGATALQVEGLQGSVLVLGAQLGKAEAALQALEGTVGQHPEQWCAAVAEASEPLQAQLAALQEQQVGASQRLGSAEAVIAQLQAAVGEQPAQWAAAVESAAQQLREALEAGRAAMAEELGAVREAAAAQAESAASQLAEVQAAVAAQPAQWAAAVQGAVEPLAAASEQHGEATKSLRERVAGIQTQMAGADAAIAALLTELATLQSTVAEQPAAWEGAIDAAVAPLHQQLTSALGEQQGLMEGLAAGVDEVRTSVQALEEAVQQQPAAWEAAAQEAAAAVQLRVESLEREQGEIAESQAATICTVGSLQAAQQQLAAQVSAAEAGLAAAATAADLHSLQQEVSSLQAAVQTQLEGISEGLAAVPPPYDDAALAGTVAGVEGTLAALQASLAGVQAAVDAVPELAESGRSVGAQVGELVAEVAAVRHSVEALQALVDAAAEKGTADGQALQQLTEAVGKLSQEQADLQGRLEGMGQETLGLASKVEALPALLLDARESASSPVPLLRIPLRSPASLAAAQKLESHPLVTARPCWWEEGSSDDDKDERPAVRKGAEVLELRANLAVQTKQTIHLEAKVQEQAAKINWLEGQLSEMRMLVVSMANGSQYSAATPSPTMGLARRPQDHRQGSDSPMFTAPATTRSAYFDCRSEDEEEETGGGPGPSTVMLPSRIRAAWGPRQAAEVGREGSSSPPSPAQTPLLGAKLKMGAGGDATPELGGSALARGNGASARIRAAVAAASDSDGSPGTESEGSGRKEALCCRIISYEELSAGSPPAVLGGLADITNARASWDSTGSGSHGSVAALVEKAVVVEKRVSERGGGRGPAASRTMVR